MKIFGIKIFFILLTFTWVNICVAQLPGYGFYKVITIQNGQVAGVGSHTDFPVLVNHTDPDLRSTGNGGNVENINGYDIRFTESDGVTLLDHQLENYNPVNGEITTWVRIPSLSSTIDTDIRIYYGNSSVSLDSSVPSVWDNNYKGVWHLHNNEQDGTVNTNHLNATGTTNASGAFIADGQSLTFNEKLNSGSQPELQILGDVTVEAWVNFTTFQVGIPDNSIIGYGDPNLTMADNHSYKLNVQSTGFVRAYWEYGAGNAESATSTTAGAFALGGWNHIAFTRDATTNTVRFYLNGNQLGGAVGYTNDPNGGTNGELFIGEGFPGYDLDGIVDEARVSDVVRSSDWIATSFNSMNSPGTFYTIGAKMAAAPDWCWAEDALAGGNEEFLDLATEPVSGVSYAVGYFNGDLSAEFPMGVNNTPDMSSTIGNQDGLVVKYDYLGNPIWAFKIGNSGDQVWIKGVEIGAGGNIFITGYFDDECEFAGVTGSSTTLLAAASKGADKEEVFIASYDSNGNLNWVRQGANIDEAIANDIAVNSTNVYITGWFENTITFDNGGTPIVSNDGIDGFIVCYDQATGNLQWESHMGDVDGGFTVNDRPYGIAADKDNVYITGTFTRTTEFASNPAFQVTALSPGNRNTFLAEYNEASGAIQWVDVIAANAGSGSCEAHALAVDANYLFVAGSVEGNVSFPGGGPLVPVVGSGEEIYACGILRSSKATMWSEIVENDNGTDVIAEDIITDGSGAVYVTGPMRGLSRFNGGLDAKNATGGDDLFVMKLKDVGTYEWTQVAVDNSDIQGNGLGFDIFGGVYVAGLMASQGTFGALPTLNDAGGDDAFIAKINCTTPSCGPSITCPPNDTVTAGAGCTAVLANYVGSETVVDGCGGGIASVMQSPSPGTNLPVGVNEVKLIVTDNSSNTDTCIMLVVVEANVNPTVVNCGDKLIGQSTGGQINNGNNFSCTAALTPGEDVYYQITVPSGNYLISIGMENVVDASDTVVSTFWVGGSCPLGSGCISADNYNISDQDFDSNNQNQLIFSAVGPGTYYFVVDSEIDSIDSYDISFDCIVSGIEFDESNCGLDVDNDGLHATVDASTNLDVNTCETVTICHTMYIENVQGGEWMDSVRFELGSCYTNISNITPVAPGPNGYHDLNGTWDAVYDGPSNTIDWGFDYSGPQSWGDGEWFTPTYSCGDYTFCFDATISATCASNNNLDINIKVSDDGVNGVSSVAGFDFANSKGFNILNPPPTISCPSNISVNNDAGLCGAQVNNIGPTASGDNCPNPFITYTFSGATTGSGSNDASGNTFNLGVTTVQYIITDSAGQQDSCQFTVTVIDNENPTLTCPGNVSISAGVNSCDTVVNGIGLLASGDNCAIDSISYKISGATSVSSGLNDASGTSFNLGVSTVHYVITDSSGNIDTCSFTVTVIDNVNPTLSCPNNVSLSCPGVVNSIAPISPNDNCAIDSVSYVLTGATTGSGLNDASGTFFNDGVTTVTYTVTDSSGNTASCNFTVTVNDNINPTLSCPNNVSIQCPGTVNSIAPISPNDNCAIDSVSYVLTGATTGSGLNDASGTFFNQGVTTVTYTVTDSSGNTASCNFTVTVNDNINPTLSCPNNVSIQCPGTVNSIAPISPNDNCAIDSVSYVLTGATTGSGLNDASGTFFNQGVTTVTYMVTDSSGNTASCNFTVTVNDNINPTLSCPNNVSIQCPGTVNSIAPISPNDNCAIDSVSYVLTGATTGSGLNDASGTFFNDGVTTVTYTVTDSSGNTASCNFTVTVNDNINPTLSCPNNVSIQCPGTVNSIAPISPNDNCAIDSVSYVLTGATTGSGLNDASGTFFNQGVTTVTYTVTDSSGNTASCNFTVTVNDNINPTLSCPNNVSIQCPGTVNSIAPISPNDNCAIDSVSYVLTGATTGSGLNDASGTFFNDGVTTVTYTVTDSSGNTASCNFTVTVNDNINPTLSCPNNVSIQCPGTVNSIAPISPNDNCAIDSVSYVLTGATTGSGLNDASGTFFNQGVTTVTYTVTDSSGNTASCNFTVTVNDNINPTLSCPNNVSIQCPGTVNSIAPISPNDNCAIDSVSYVLTGATTGSGLNDASGTFFNQGVTTVTYTVTDSSGNTASCNFTVTVNDNINPTLSCPNSTTLNVDPGFCSVVVSGIAPLGVSDNCAIDSVSYVLSGATTGNGLNDASGTAFNVGITSLTYIVYDMSGNVDSCMVTITVVDNELPSINCPAPIVICDTFVTVPLPNFSDNCKVDSIYNDFNGTNDATGIYPYGITTVNWTIIDSSGNINTCSTTIEVEKEPTAYAGEDQILYGVNSTYFTATGVGNWSIMSGYGNILNTNNSTSYVDALEPGQNIFEWTVQGNVCPDAYDDVMISYYELKIPNGFSPNGDGDNDYFEIKGINLLENEVVIINRWGVELYTSKNYQNDWDGRSEDGKDLPEDTYFYIVKIPGLDKELSGFVVLKR